MSTDFFRIYRGLELDEAAQFLTGIGAPGAADDTSTAPRGSYFTDTATGDFYIKVAQGVGTDKWKRVATEDYVSTVTSTGISWREPVAVIDTTATDVTTLKADLDADNFIQGVPVTAGMRILGANVTGNKNIFVVSGTAGNWTLTEDLNLESAGDAVYVIGGDDAGKTFQYDGTNWTWILGQANTEDAFIRAFIGKDAAGNELPLYTSTHVISNNDSLETAAGKLDAEAGYANAFIGKTGVGNVLPNYSSVNVVANGDNLETAIGKLDAEIGPAVVNGTVIQASNTANANITALDGEVGHIDTYLGKTAGNSTPNYSSTSFVATNDSLTTAVGKLDAAIASTSLTCTVTNVTSITAVDTVTGVAAEWNVYIRQSDTPTNVRVFKVFAMHNGTDVDSTIFATLSSGGAISGFHATVTLSGGSLVLNVQSTVAVDVKAQRLSAIAAF
jgi:hypothetical protein